MELMDNLEVKWTEHMIDWMREAKESGHLK